MSGFLISFLVADDGVAKERFCIVVIMADDDDTTAGLISVLVFFMTIERLAMERVARGMVREAIRWSIILLIG